MERRPRLRTVEKYVPPYQLNRFPSGFAVNLGREIVYFLASRNSPRLEGTDWEEIFARIIGADWRPSNVGLDDIVLGQTAWGAKTVKNRKPSTAGKARLISGRNSPFYSYGDREITSKKPDELGSKILDIWNERVSSVRSQFMNVRTIVLLKSDDLLELAVFEINTIIHEKRGFWWQWNERNNLEGFQKTTNEHKFTWQPHGSQFTVIEDVPKERLALKIRMPPKLDMEKVLEAIQFNDSWIEIIK